MQPNLDRGKLRPPASIQQARERLLLLDREIGRIEQQIADPARSLQHFTRRLGRKAYVSWRVHADSTLDLFNIERRLLRSWLETAEHPLFRAAYELLKTLRDADCDFDPPELELINKLDNHFKE